MICPNCGAKTGVISTRRSRRAIRRRRECKVCGHRFTTYEVQAVYLSDLLKTLDGEVVDQLWGIGRGIGVTAQRLSELHAMMDRPLAHFKEP